MKKGLAVGVFDLFHLGHLNLVKAAKSYCDHLTIAVHDDVKNIKNINFVYSLQERMEIVSSIIFVDKVIPYNRVDKLLKEVEFDVFFHGPDQSHQYFQRAFEWCRSHNKEIILIERTEGISSSLLRNILEKKNI